MATYEKSFLLSLYRDMVRIRAFEEHAAECFTKGMLAGNIHLSIGQEAAEAGAFAAIEPRDYFTSTHRGHGHAIARGADPKRAMAELFGKAAGYCKGKGGSMHIMAMDKGILGANGIVGGGIPMATGAGYSAKYRGTDQVTLCFFGDGAAILIGGASVNKASIANVIIGTFLYQGLVTMTPTVINSLIHLDISEIIRIIVSNGMIVYALTRKMGGKK